MKHQVQGNYFSVWLFVYRCCRLFDFQYNKLNDETNGGDKIAFSSGQYSMLILDVQLI